MCTSQFKSLLEERPSLCPQQLDDLRAAADVLHQRANAMSAFDKAVEGTDCPHCNSFKFTKNGFSRGLQRYRCNACSRTFNAATNTPQSRLQSKEQFFQQGECLMKGLTIRAAAQEMSVAVSTAFRRRHRLLEAVVSHQP
jgi:transposase-like protein